MRHSLIAVWLFIGCLVVVFAAMGWLTWTILRLDRQDEQSRRDAEVEENVRLALWRMDSALAPILAQENARPWDASEAHATDGLSQHVLLRFEIDAHGAIASPQALAAKKSKSPQPSKYSERLAQLQDKAMRPALLRALPPQTALALTQTTPPEQIAQIDEQFGNDYGQSIGKQRQTEAVQQMMNANEYNRRNFVYRNTQQQAYAENPSNKAQTKQRTAPSIGSTTSAGESMFTPVWVNSSLFLLRRIEVDGETYAQGCWLDWQSLEGWLRSQISDLLPNARFEAASSAAPTAREAGRLLAALPARLVPGELPDAEGSGLTPLKISIIAVWVCVLIAAAAVALLLRGALLLSERRGAFVSAVTHELRTPLTTFRMYTQMLGDGMVSDPEKQTKYLAVLRVEADRLSHLVENVLAYARLEKGSAGGRGQDLPATELLQRVTERPRERAAQAGVELSVDTTGDDVKCCIHADPAAVEQIVFNLVDNACKYARTEHPRVIIAVNFPDTQKVAIVVSDNGPGIAPAEGRKLFRPFSKSARDAAHSAPGVGLGLALSRRLAREMGGDLGLDEKHSGGARFVLTLPTR